MRGSIYNIVTRLLFALVLFFTLAGCGGYDGGELPLSVGDHTLVFSTYSASQLQPISIVSFKFNLPRGVTLALTPAADGSLRNILGSSYSVSDSFCSMIRFTEYTSSSIGATGGTLRLEMTGTPNSTLRNGELLRLKFTVLLGQSVFASSFTALNPHIRQQSGYRIDTYDGSRYLNVSNKVGMDFQIMDNGD